MPVHPRKEKFFLSKVFKGWRQDVVSGLLPGNAAGQPDAKGEKPIVRKRRTCTIERDDDTTSDRSAGTFTCVCSPSRRRLLCVVSSVRSFVWLCVIMCGIIGYVGQQQACGILLDGLKKLEYRGYDSYGVATVSHKKILCVKKTGKISAHDPSAAPLSGTIGIAHTRWATHGGITEVNTHPHLDCTGTVAVVHNGVVENHQELRAALQRAGHIFRSETDTEVIPHLLEDALKVHPFPEAVRETMKQLRGRNGCMALLNTGSVVAARQGSPLIIGIGIGETFIASDVTAFFNHTRNVIYLDDGEMAVIQKEGEPLSVLTIAEGNPVSKRTVTIDWSPEQAGKGGYPHFLIKEIMEQKETLARVLAQDDRQLLRVADAINRAYGTFFVGCGTAGKVCFTAEYLFSTIAGRHVNFVPGSEFSNYHHFLKPETLVIAISQSGETADVLEAIETAKKAGSRVISLVNVMGSTLVRKSDEAMMINAGPEKAVASTKATTAQLALVTLLAYATAGRLEEGKRLLVDTAAAVNDMLNPRYEERVKSLAGKLSGKKDIFIIGRGASYPIALEAAIKIMEVSYIHAQGFAGGELKHGPLALIESGVPCIVLVSNDETKAATLSNATEVRSRGGFIIGVAPENNPVFDEWLKVPDVGMASPIVNIIPIQLLAYHLGVLRGNEVDHCRNLAKSVTVI